MPAESPHFKPTLGLMDATMIVAGSMMRLLRSKPLPLLIDLDDMPGHRDDRLRSRAQRREHPRAERLEHVGLAETRRRTTEQVDDAATDLPYPGGRIPCPQSDRGVQLRSPTRRWPRHLSEHPARSPTGETRPPPPLTSAWGT